MLEPAKNQVILGGVDYSGVPGKELYRVIVVPLLEKRAHDGR